MTDRLMTVWRWENALGQGPFQDMSHTEGLLDCSAYAYDDERISGRSPFGLASPHDINLCFGPEHHFGFTTFCSAWRMFSCRHGRQAIARRGQALWQLRVPAEDVMVFAETQVAFTRSLAEPLAVYDPISGLPVEPLMDDLDDPVSRLTRAIAQSFDRPRNSFGHARALAYLRNSTLAEVQRTQPQP